MNREGLVFTIPGPPRPKLRARRAGNSTRMIDPPENKEAKKAIQWAAREAFGGSEPWTGPLACRLTFEIKRPRSHYSHGELKDDAPYWHIIKPDSDNLEKIALDGMTGIVYVDDSQVCIVRNIKKYANGEPQTSIVVEQLQPCGGTAILAK